MSIHHQPKVKILLKLLSTALSGHRHTFEDVTQELWPEVCRYAARQGVLAIAWDGLNAAIKDGAIGPEQMPNKALMLKWAYNVEQLEARYLKQESVIAKLASTYSSEGIKLMILKGYGLSRCYPTPEHRNCSDIDIYLCGEQQRGDKLIERTFNIAIQEDSHHHTVFHLDGVMVENHYDFLNVHAHTSSREIEQHLKTLANKDMKSIEVGQNSVYLPGPDCHALFLLRHAAAHFSAAEIVMRHIIDWAMFVRHYHDKVDWHMLRAISKEQKMEKFLDAINGIASDVCGIDISLMPDTVRRVELERRILGDILEPEFKETKPTSGLLRIVAFKWRRWWANRWKHRLVYRESLAHSFMTQTWSHLLKPKHIKS